MLRRPGPRRLPQRLIELWCWLFIAICVFLVFRALLFGVPPNELFGR